MYRKLIFVHTKAIFSHKSVHSTCRSLHIKPGLTLRLACVSNPHIGYTQRGICSTPPLSSYSDSLKKIFTINAESIADSSQKSEEIEYIPPPPEPPEAIEEVIHTLNSLGEPTFEALGLAGWTPAGILRQGLELVHVGLDVPWWIAIAISTAILRTCVFPLVIKSQRNAAKMSKVMPKIQALQTKMTEARTSGNYLEASRCAYNLQQLMTNEDVNPLKNVLVPLAQAPIFLSMFIGLRSCATLPVESFKTGGILWFTDLTVADPYLILPVLTSLTLLVTMEIGAEGQRLNQQTSKTLKYVFRAIPLFIFPFTINFSSAILCYWLTTNMFSLVQVSFLRIPRVRDYFNIDKVVKAAPVPTKGPKKKFLEGFKDSWSNMKVAAEVKDRHRVDEMNFKRAGVAPRVKTFKKNPLYKDPIDVKATIKDR